jgi:carbamoyl-phosphate synthase/aspartate carbamoyltransferase/dihydroorotase
VSLTHEAPRRIFDLPVQPDTYVEVDPNDRYSLDHEGLFTKCGWTPFEGVLVQGRVRRVVLRGRNVCQDGQVQAEPGSGRIVAPVGFKG